MSSLLSSWYVLFERLWHETELSKHSLQHTLFVNRYQQPVLRSPTHAFFVSVTAKWGTLHIYRMVIYVRSRERTFWQWLWATNAIFGGDHSFCFVFSSLAPPYICFDVLTARLSEQYQQHRLLIDPDLSGFFCTLHSLESELVLSATSVLIGIANHGSVLGFAVGRLPGWRMRSKGLVVVVKFCSTRTLQLCWTVVLDGGVGRWCWTM